jgi:prepilin-type N-terminal cleavage/methylation domain-containing protein
MLRRKVAGFTLLELMIVITVIVIIAMIAIPNLISSRLVANETVAIENLRSICTAQQQFRESDKADEDTDGTGEYGGFGELSGLVGVRGGPLSVPTNLTGSMRQLTPGGELQRTGYMYRMYLPDANGHGVRENPGGGYLPGQVDPDLSECFWVVYAWPLRYGISGRRTFCLGHQGDVISTDDARYTGSNCPDIRAGNAFMTADLDSITARTAVGTSAADGNIWRPLQ